jgi:hypothetical protein
MGKVSRFLIGEYTYNSLPTTINRSRRLRVEREDKVSELTGDGGEATSVQCSDLLGELFIRFHRSWSKGLDRCRRCSTVRVTVHRVAARDSDVSTLPCHRLEAVRFRAPIIPPRAGWERWRHHASVFVLSRNKTSPSSCGFVALMPSRRSDSLIP